MQAREHPPGIVRRIAFFEAVRYNPNPSISIFIHVPARGRGKCDVSRAAEIPTVTFPHTSDKRTV